MWSPQHAQDYASPGLVDKQVRSALYGEQAVVYDQLKAVVDGWGLTKEQAAWCHEGTLCRYLRARKWELQPAADMLEATIKWREEAQPGKLCYDDIAGQADYLANYMWGFDAAGHVLCYMRVSRDPPGDADEKLKFIIHNIEEATRWLDAHAHLFNGVERLTYMVDLRGFTMGNSVRDMKVAKEWLHVLGNHQPERLHRAYLMNYPSAFKIFFGMLKPFMDPVTKAKVVWCPHDNLREFFLNEGMEMAWFEKEYGGDLALCKIPNCMSNPDYKPFFHSIAPAQSPYNWIMVAAAVAIAQAAAVAPPPPRALERALSDVSVHLYTMREREGDGDSSDDGLSTELTDDASGPPVAVEVDTTPRVCVRKPDGDLVMCEVNKYSTAHGVLEELDRSGGTFLTLRGQVLEPTERLYKYHGEKGLVFDMMERPQGCCSVM